jgi:hypothetical protein
MLNPVEVRILCTCERSYLGRPRVCSVLPPRPFSRHARQPPGRVDDLVDECKWLLKQEHVPGTEHWRRPSTTVLADRPGELWISESQPTRTKWPTAWWAWNKYRTVTVLDQDVPPAPESSAPNETEPDRKRTVGRSDISRSSVMT